MSESNGQKDKNVYEFDEFLPDVTVKLKDRSGVVHNYVVHESNWPKTFWDLLCRLQKCRVEAEKGQTEAFGQGSAMNDVQCDIIRHCITEEGREVSKETILGWGQQFRVFMFQLVSSQNGLSAKGSDDLGKESGGGEVSGGGSVSPPTSECPSPTAVSASAPESSLAGSTT
jgi:hypothetical protein